MSCHQANDKSCAAMNQKISHSCYNFMKCNIMDPKEFPGPTGSETCPKNMMDLCYNAYTNHCKDLGDNTQKLHNLSQSVNCLGDRPVKTKEDCRNLYKACALSTHTQK